jgi:hypothetical protein
LYDRKAAREGVRRSLDDHVACRLVEAQRHDDVVNDSEVTVLAHGLDERFALQSDRDR